MQMYIPEIGDQIQLLEDWAFDLYLERRNKNLLEHIGWSTAGNGIYVFIDPNGKRINRLERDPVTRELINPNPHAVATLPRDTILRVERIYVRAGAPTYSSITFRIPSTKFRFWAKLRDVNQIQYQKI